MDTGEAQAPSAAVPKLEATTDHMPLEVALPRNITSSTELEVKREERESASEDKNIAPIHEATTALIPPQPTDARSGAAGVVLAKEEIGIKAKPRTASPTDSNVMESNAVPEQSITNHVDARGETTVPDGGGNGEGNSGTSTNTVFVQDDANNDEDEDGEDEDDEDTDDEDYESELEDPSQDIKGDLENILSGDLEFSGAFSFSRSYPAAPNPALSIDGLGTVGLPLSERDAAAIKARSEQAPFGKVDQTIVDKSVRDTWEIDAAKVHFENGAWEPFMAQTVREVCQVLGVNFEASKPRCELYKLLLYEKGSHFLPHVDTEKVNGMFATIVIVLPSRFTGGAVHVSHGDLHSTYDTSPGSLVNTSVLAWYTDVEHEVKEITSGYRLALSFNLVHTTSALRPALSVSTLPSRLRHVLHSWRRAESDGNAPKKIIYLLSHKYSQAALEGSALKGVDAHLVAILDSIASEHDIHLGLANLTCTERGGANDYGGRDDRWGRCYYDEPSEDDDDVSMCEVDETDVNIEDLVDLDGMDIGDSIDYDLQTEVIPKRLVDEITSGGYDDQEYEGYQGNYGGTLERFYRRTVLVMWPGWADFDMIHGADGFEYACQRIRTSVTMEPTIEERDLTHIILVRASTSQCAAVVGSVCHAAVRWGDLSLWFRAVKACDAERSVAALGGEKHIYLAVTAFGFVEVKPSLERALERDPSNVSALRFLERFEAWVASQNSEQLASATKDWVSAQRTKRFDALKPVGKDEHKALTALAMKYGGGVDFLENKVLPLIKPTTDNAALLEYAVSLKDDKGIPAEARARMARDLFATALAKVNFYAAAAPAANTGYSYSYAYNKPTEEPAQLEKAKPYVKASLELGPDDLFPTVVDKLLALTGLANDVVVRRVKGVLLPVVTYVNEISRTLSGGVPPPALRKISATASALHLRSALADLPRLQPTDVPSLIQAVIGSDKPGESLLQVTTKLETLQIPIGTLRAVIEEMGAKRTQIDATGNSVNPLLLRLLQKYVNAIDLTYTRPYQSYAWGAAQRAPAVQKPAIAALEFCLTLQLPEACKFVIGRLLNPAKLDLKYIQEQLAPLVPDMRALLVKYKQPLTSEAFATAFRKILLHWVQKAMGPRPPDTAAALLANLKSWTCTCDVCPPIRKFLTSEPEDCKSWQRIGAPKRRHVETFLFRHAKQVATFVTIRSTPQGLTITKTKAIVGPAKWTHAQMEGKKLLRGISAKASELQAALGPDYARIVAGLEGRSVAASSAAATTAAPVASGSTTTASAPRTTASGQASTSASQPAAAPPPMNPAQPAYQGSFHAIHAAVASANAAGAGQHFYVRPAIDPQAPPPAVQTAPATHAGTHAPAAASIPVTASTSKRPDEAEHAQRKRRKMAYDDQDVIDLT